MISVLLLMGAVWCAFKANAKAILVLKEVSNPPALEPAVIRLSEVRPNLMAQCLVERVRRDGWTPERLTLALQLGPAARVPLGLCSAA